MVRWKISAFYITVPAALKAMNPMEKTRNANCFYGMHNSWGKGLLTDGRKKVGRRLDQEDQREKDNDEDVEKKEEEEKG